MKRTIWLAVVAIVLAVAVAIPVIAQQRQGGPGRGPGGGPLPMLRGLNLTDSQQEQIRALTSAQRSGQNPRRNLMDLERQLQQAILADTPDPQKIDDLKNSIAAATAAELTARIDMQSRIAQILTPEQRAQARDALAKGLAGEARCPSSDSLGVRSGWKGSAGFGWVLPSACGVDSMRSVFGSVVGAILIASVAGVVAAKRQVIDSHWRDREIRDRRGQWRLARSARSGRRKSSAADRRGQ